MTLKENGMCFIAGLRVRCNTKIACEERPCPIIELASRTDGTVSRVDLFNARRIRGLIMQSRPNPSGARA